MKRRKKLLMSAMLVGTVCMLQVGQSSVVALDMAPISVENVKNNIDNTGDEKYTPYYQEASQWYDKDGNIQTPITLDEELWQSTPIFSERCELCAIPDEVLQNATTEDLLQLVVDCKLNYLISLYGDVDMAMTRITECFNGIRELMSREDCGQVVLDMYNKYEIPFQKFFDDNIIGEFSDIQEFKDKVKCVLEDEEYFVQIRKDSQVANTLNILEWILTQKCVAEQFDTIAKEEVIQDVLNKTKQKNSTEYATFIEEYFISAIKNGQCLEYGQCTENYGAEIMSARGKAYVTILTPSKKKMEIEYINNPTVLTYERSKTYLGNYVKYLDVCVNILDNGTSKYNCHAYAWFTMLPGYHHLAKACQLNDASTLANDSAIKKYSNPVKGGVLYHSAHSVFVQELNYTCPQANVYNGILVREKISGAGPLVEWPLQFSSIYGAAYTCYYK